jgi:hypothetical protein
MAAARGLGGLESVKKTQQVARDGLGAIRAGPLPARMWYCRIPGEIRVRQATYPFFSNDAATATRVRFEQTWRCH